MTDDKTILDADSFDACRPMLGQIAHDFNNLLTPLLAYPSLLKSYMPPDSPGNELLEAIDKASRDMIHINENLMLLASKGTPDKAAVNIADTIESALSRFAGSRDLTNVRISRDIDTTIPALPLNTEHFSRALESVLANACESSTEALEIEVSAQLMRISPENRASYSAPFAGEYVRIRIKDNGPGFSPDIFATAAMPFVTTKKEMKKRGSGLGLTVALLVCRDHGGFLFFENAAQGGAEVSLFLPAPVSAPLRDGASAMPGSNKMSQGGRTPRDMKRILLVDDEKTILKLFHMIITSALPHCEVETAPNGKEALDLFSARHHGVLVMDLHMPVMDGQTAFQEIISLSKKRNWEPPAVVFCTGFAPPDVINNIVSDSSYHCLLSKPVRGEVLVETIKSRLS